MPARAAEAAGVFAVAAIITVAIAAPVLRAPSERVFGKETVGRHHDPFTVMAQFERPITIGVYSQPVTDVPGALLARVAGGVAAFNWMVLLSFPLSAAAAYLLARHLTLSPAGAGLAALAYAFSPFHVSHAAYHIHIAQTQWLPLYLLALWRCLDDASPVAVGLLCAATLGVTLSNFYGGLIAVVITPVAVAAYWLVTSRANARSVRQLVVTVGALALMAVAGIEYVSYAAGDIIVNNAAFAFPRSDLFRYSANWWSYLVPPVQHPLLGATAHRLWEAGGVREGLLEQQVSLGWGIVALGLIASFRWLGPWSRGTDVRQRAFLAPVPVLVVVAAAALVCSLSPEGPIGRFTLVRPSSLLYDVVPMFRSYARFGVVVQLMAALLAGLGVDHLRRSATRSAQIVCLALVALAGVEYAVAPWEVWRDVLPTAAHRWVMRQPGQVRVLDCMPLNGESASVQWLTGYRVASLGGSTSDCTEPNLAHKLAATGYTHLLVRSHTSDGQWFAERPAPDGLRVAASFDDGQVFSVTSPTPAVHTATMTGFFPREGDATWTWRWMGEDAAWAIVNAGAHPIVATLDIELSAFHEARQLELLLDGRRVQTFIVEPGPARRIYQIGPLTVASGGHQLVFHATEAPPVASDVITNIDANGAYGTDGRRLSFALGTWNWTVAAEQP